MLAVKQPWRAVQAVADSQVEALRRVLLKLWDTPMPGLEAALAQTPQRAGPALQVVEQALYPAELEATNKTKDVFLRCINGAGEATWKTGMRPVKYTPKIRTAEGPGVGDLTGAFELSFDKTSPQALMWAHQNAGQLITGNVDRANIRRIIAGGFSDGKEPRVMAREIQKTVGMSQPQFKKWLAMDNYKDRDKYEKQARRDRALLIARTETMRASNEGQMEAWRQGVKQRRLTGQENRVWITAIDDRTCTVCAPMDGAIIPMKGSFQLPPQGFKIGGAVRMPPAHPACRCAMGLTELGVTQPQGVGGEGEDWEPVAQTVSSFIPQPKLTGKTGSHGGPPLPVASRPPTVLTNVDEMLDDSYRLQRQLGHQARQLRANAVEAHGLAERATAAQRPFGKAALDRLATDSKKIWKTQERMDFLAKHAVPVEERLVLKVRFKDKAFTKVEQDYITSVIQDMTQLVHKNAVAKNGKAQVIEIFYNDDGRAFARGAQLNLGHVENASTIAHELGHAIEALSKKKSGTIHKNVFTYFDDRIKYKGTGIKKMKELRPYQAQYFDDWEIADPDEFGNDYMGKIYRKGTKTDATEISSMAIEDVIAGTSRDSDREMMTVVVQSWRGQKYTLPKQYKKKIYQPAVTP